ncbi:broad-complex core protein isoforms 1/2/3/4/5 isoform X1 [Vespula maculifrons]|uniref:Broad-complex core protein isoforms 1/2/3/4/5 isoform X1 n=1 Tax=Vespula maculifrons TaxID=7453 RepID=A0ABD2CA97_VESMC
MRHISRNWIKSNFPKASREWLGDGLFAFASLSISIIITSATTTTTSTTTTTTLTRTRTRIKTTRTRMRAPLLRGARLYAAGADLQLSEHPVGEEAVHLPAVRQGAVQQGIPETPQNVGEEGKGGEGGEEEEEQEEQEEQEEEEEGGTEQNRPRKKSNANSCEICLENRRKSLHLCNEAFAMARLNATRSVKARTGNGMHPAATTPPSAMYRIPPPTAGGINEPQECPYCRRTFSCYYSLKRHFQDKHEQSDTLFVCEFCNRRYRTKNSLTTHKSLQHRGSSGMLKRLLKTSAMKNVLGSMQQAQQLQQQPQ